MPRTRGYTLLEMVVVLAILGLLVGLTAPALYRTYQSAMRQSQVEGALAQLGALGLTAYALGVSFELSADSVNQKLPNGRPLLDLPAGWRLQVPKPVHFNFSGLCDGGALNLVAPDGTNHPITLEAPTCRVRTDSGRL